MHIIFSFPVVCLANRTAADVTSDTEIRGVVQKVLQKYRRIDVLHNNVGKCIFGGVPELSEDEWTSVMDTNVKSLFLACKHVLPVMQEQAYGVITNISSIASIGIGGYDMPSYYTSKAAVNQFTRSIAVKYASEGIRANSILPGLIDTPIIHAVTGVSDYYGSEEKMVKARNLSSPTGKMGDAWDIANVAVFLASKDARYVNGVALPVDGGLICKLGLDG